MRKNMTDLLTVLVPSSLSPSDTIILLVTSMASSLISTAFGLGGGITLIAVMAMFMPAVVVIPIHAAIQAGSNIGRVSVMYRYIEWPVLLAFGAGGIIGTLVGAQILRELPDGWLEVMLGLFIIWTSWGPMPTLQQESPLRIGTAGALTSILSLFVGATGPLVSGLLKGMRFDRMRHVATFSACMVTQQVYKLIIFGVIGFAFGSYLPFLAAMIICGFIGTLIGRQVLVRLHDRAFGLILNLILVGLGLRLIYTGGSSLFS